MARNDRLPPPQPDGHEIARALRALIPAGQVVELRAKGVRRPGWRGRPEIHLGWFDDRAEMVAEAMRVSPMAQAVYFTPNPVKPEVMARCVGRMEPADDKAGTKDHDIARRRWLLIDCDAVRPADISSSDEEHAAALARVAAIRAALTTEGWPLPVMGDSSNGGHLMYLIDEPSDDKDLVSRCLKALGAEHDDARVKVDPLVANPARIWKLYGTPSRKGDNVAERPHRVARLLEVPPQLVQVTHEQLEALAARAPSPAPSSGRPGAPRGGRGGGAPPLDSRAWLDQWLSEHAARLGACVGPTTWKSGRKWVFKVCPFNASHDDKTFFIGQVGDGAIMASCRHASCAGNDWHALRDLVEDGWRSRNRGEEPPPWYGKSRIRAHRHEVSPPEPPPPVDPDTGEALLDRPPGQELPPVAEGAGEPPVTGGRGGAGGEGDNWDGRVVVELAGDLEEQATVLWRALVEECDTSDLYRAPNGLVRVHRDIGVQGERLLVTELNPASFRAYVGRRISCLVQSGKRWVSGYPTKDLAEYMLLSVPPGVRVVRDVYRMPAWVGSPPALVIRGYDPISTVVVDSGALDLATIPRYPTDQQVDEAIGYWRWLTAGFPLAAQADFTHVIALALALVMRPQIAGPVPLFFAAAPQERSGKSLLMHSIHQAVIGEELEICTEAKDDDEWGKLITTKLVGHPRMVCVDNVRRTLDSAPLAALLTSARWTARRLGRNDDGGIELPARAVWTATGNQPRFSDELAARTLMIRLEPLVEEPSQRSGFKTQLPKDALRARPDLLWALHVLVARWLADNRPRETAKRLGGFEEFVRVVGGVLLACGVPDFLGNREEAKKRASGGLDEWRTLAGEWLEKHGEDRVTLGQVHELCKENNLFAARLGDKGEHSEKIRLGRLLGDVEHRVIGRHRLINLGQDRKSKTSHWALRPLEELQHSAPEGHTPPTLRRHSAQASSQDATGTAPTAESAECFSDPSVRARTRPTSSDTAEGQIRPRVGYQDHSAHSASEEKKRQNEGMRGGVSETPHSATLRHTPPGPAGTEEGEL